MTAFTGLAAAASAAGQPAANITASIAAAKADLDRSFDSRRMNAEPAASAACRQWLTQVNDFPLSSHHILSVASTKATNLTTFRGSPADRLARMGSGG